MALAIVFAVAVFGLLVILLLIFLTQRKHLTSEFKKKLRS